jgi:hypothetical protein
MHRIGFLIAFLSLSACTNKTLDGGSTGDTKGAGTGSEIADAPLSGTIAAQPFEAKTTEIYFNESIGQWFLSVDNYEGDCGKITNRPPSSESMTVNVVGIEPAVASIAIAPGTTRYATLQRGVYEASEGTKPDARNAQSGTLVLDTWDETEGAEIRGKLKLVADEESSVEGTFTAKVCPARAR